ncbi:hypothetical protein Dimus_017719 [Dionaea muscipula]
MQLQRNMRTVTSSLSSILRGYVQSAAAINLVKQTHAVIFINALTSDVTLQTDILLAYTRCGLLMDARQVFDKMPNRSMHSWNILISSYVQNSLYSDAIDVFRELLKMGLRPDHYTLPAAMKASTGAPAEDFYKVGKTVHSWVVRLGFEEYVVLGCSVMDFYVKFGDLHDARKVFASLPFRDVVAWNAMISGLGRGEFFVETFTFFRAMLVEGVKMDRMVVPSILHACGGEGDLIKGKEVHGQVVKSSMFESDIAIGNSLISMYSKSGCLYGAENVFKNMRELNLVTWTTMISCYGHHGKGREALMYFKRMRDHGFKPNSVTMTAILAGCSHSGLIDQGRMIFNSMKNDYGVEPSVEHYACLVDLLGRCGCLEEALELIRDMEPAPTASVWGALLSACMIHKDAEIAEVAASHLFVLEPRNSSNYIALSHVYDSLRLQTGVSRIRTAMRDSGLLKTPGCSWIITEGRVHKFYQGDFLHPLAWTIYETLSFLDEAMFPQGCG